jgi:5-methylcytosine-specific restriction endonuclease McrA
VTHGIFETVSTVSLLTSLKPFKPPPHPADFQYVNENKKIPVTDAAVDEYVTKTRAGVSAANVFPVKMSDCDFTPAQREKIILARKERKALLKNLTATPATPAPTTINPPAPTPTTFAPPPIKPTTPTPNTSTALNKLKKILFLQGGTCFFCGKPIKEKDASIEHLNPKSRGGTSTEDNEVVCHKTLNQIFGDMELKHKFEFILRMKGAIQCPEI